MKKFLRIVAIVLAACACLGALIGCKDGEDKGTEAEAEAGKVRLASEYRIVFPENNDYGNEAKHAMYLQSELKSRFGIELEVVGDYSESGTYDSETKEILVGHTAYDQSKKALAKVTRCDWLITEDTNKIVIIGGNIEALEEAIKYFVEDRIAEKDGKVTLDVAEHLEAYEYAHAETGVKIASLNLRYARHALENNQGIREPRVYNFMKAKLPDSLGVQECELFWRTRLVATIGKLGYVPVQDVVYSKDEGAYAFKNFIFYNSNTTKLVEGGRIWLSETPDVPSKGFGATNWISAGWAILENKETGAQYVHVNTHLFVGSAEIRVKESEVLRAKIKEFTDKGYKVFVTGDFNSAPESDVYKGMTADLLDSRHTAPITTDMRTYNAYTEEGVDIPASSYRSADYCFYNDDENVYAEKFEVYDKWDGGYISDHNAVLAHFTLYKR